MTFIIGFFTGVLFVSVLWFAWSLCVIGAEADSNKSRWGDK